MNIQAGAGAKPAAAETESAYAWLRLAASTLLATIGGVGMWSFVVVLPAAQADFGVDRASASLPFTATMLGFGFGGILMGRLLDRFGIVVPAVLGAIALAAGLVASSYSTSIWQLALWQAVVGFGSSATLGPMIADISHWFTRRRGIAVTVCSAGNSLAGAVWPPIVQHFITTDGWRPTQVGVGIACLAIMLPVALLTLRRRAAAHDVTSAGAAAAAAQGNLGVSPQMLMGLLAVAGVACCVAMSMPQVHLVAYCGDLGYGPARGAEMLSLMMALNIVSRIGSGWIADRIGGLGTLLLGSVAQALALFLYMLFDGLASLYVISALFGLFQGGIVPMYAIIVREYFPPREAGMRVGMLLMATLLGMAIGGWMSGAIFDLTGSYQAAFLNGLLWNLLHTAIVLWLVVRPGRRLVHA